MNNPLAPTSSDASAGQVPTLDVIFDFSCVLDSLGRVTRLTGEVFTAAGFDPAKIISQKFSETVFWQSYEDTASELESAIAGASFEPRWLSSTFRVSADEKRLVSLFIRRFGSQQDSPEIFIGGRFVSGSGDTNDTIEFLAAADSAEIGLWYWNFDDDGIYTTRKCRELLNIHGAEPVSCSSFLASVHPDDSLAARQFLDDARTSDQTFKKEFRVCFEDGSVQWLCGEGRSQAKGNNAPPRMLGIIRKITEEKHAALDLEQGSAREKQARADADEANRAKDFFLAFVSHELRSPLNAILGWSKILLTKQVDEETRVSALQTIEKSARLQSKLIDDLVDSARVASGKLRLEYRPTNLYEIVNATFQAQMPDASSHGLEMSFTADRDDTPVYGDAGRLQQIFGNLLSNAVKFTPSGGKINIDMQSDRGTAVVTVADTGQGIATDALPNIFKQFSQGDLTQNRRNSGLGLGLSIVNILVEKHGGTIRAESEGPGKGAKFIVTLPLSVARAFDRENDGTPAAIDGTSLSGLRILIVEDDNDSREVLQLFLEQCGADVESAESVKSAFELLDAAKTPPNLIISDLAMPETDGYSFMSKIRQRPESAGGRVPALALSAFADGDSRRRALDAGFTRYETKPFDPELLVKDILAITVSRRTE